MSISSPKRTASLAVAALVVVAACTGGGGSPSTTSGVGGASGQPNAPADLTGEISISGSSTVLPISQGIQELFNEAYPDVAIRVDGPGTGDGFELFCNGETDISNASRAIRDDEVAACEENGVEYVELKVAIDGLSILTSPNNDAVSCLSYADLYALVGPESDAVANWNDAEPLARELGSTTDLPDAPLEISGPGEESGTYDYFTEEVIGEFAEDRGQEAVTRKTYNSSPNDNVILEGVEGSDSSLGWVGYAYAVEAGDQVKLVEVSAPDGECVAPDPETIASGDYPLARDLFIYVNTAKAAESEALAAFVDFHLDAANLGTIVDETGYVALGEDVLAEQVTAWAGR